jgi:D-amino-acid oxidase
LQAECTRLGIEIHRRVFEHIDEALELYPGTTAVFNCTGLGALTLGGVEDKKMYSARVSTLNCMDKIPADIQFSKGQILLVEGPKEPIPKMAFRAPDRDGEATHIFPRGPNGRGGVILGGCRQKDNWDGEVDLDFAEVIKKRCCALVPELGKPEELRVIKHGVGFRRKELSLPRVLIESQADSITAGREGGARIETEKINDRLVIHSYGAGGTGFQASW